MDVATRYDVLVLELTLCSPDLFRYADKQLLSSRDPDAVRRLVERKLQSLRSRRNWCFGFVLFFIIYGVGLLAVSGQLSALPSLALWAVFAVVIGQRAVRDRARMQDSADRLIEFFEQERAGAKRAI